jgi:hypothetical protein
LKAELEQKHKLCQRLEIEITDMRKKFEINHNELVKYDDMRKEYFHFCQWKVTQQYKKKNKKLPKQRIVINGLHHEFKVADTIQDWIDSGSELVTDLDETNRYKWLARMQVNFQSLPPGTVAKTVLKIKSTLTLTSLLFSLLFWQKLRL